MRAAALCGTSKPYRSAVYKHHCGTALRQSIRHKPRACDKSVCCRSRRSDTDTQEARSEVHADSQQLQAPAQGSQEQHQGIDATVRPRGPAHRPGIPPVAGIALGLAVFGAAVWSLVAVWKQKDDKLRRTAQHAQDPTPGSSSDSSSSDSSSSSGGSSGSRRSRAKATPLAPEALATVRSRIVCRQFSKTGNCKYGDDCRYAHVRDPLELRKLRAANGRLRLANAEANEGSVKEAPAKEAPAKEAPTREAPAKESPAKRAPAKAEEESNQKKADSGLYRPDTDWKTRYTMHGIYIVPADQVDNIGALMGFRGTRIKGVCYMTGTEIIVPKGPRDPNLPVSIDIHGNSAASIEKAQQMIAECFVEYAERESGPQT